MHGDRQVMARHAEDSRQSRRQAAGASHLGNDGAARPRGCARIRLHRPRALVLEHQVRPARPC